MLSTFPARLSAIHFFAENLRTVKGSVQHDADHGVKRIRSKLFRARHEIARGVVHHGIDAPQFLFSLRGGSLNCGIIAHIAGGIGRFSGASLISWHTSRKGSSRRPTRNNFAPSFAKCRAMDRPKAQVPPPLIKIPPPLPISLAETRVTASELSTASYGKIAATEFLAQDSARS